MSHKETEDINVAMEWFNEDKARVDKKKKDKKKDQENACEESIWDHRATITKGYSPRYSRKYDTIDWSK